MSSAEVRPAVPVPPTLRQKNEAKLKGTPIMQSHMATENRALAIDGNGDFVRIHCICICIVHFKLEYVGQFSQINVASCSLNMLHQNHQVYTACTPIIAHLIKTYNGHQWSIPPTSSFQARPRLEIA